MKPVKKEVNCKEIIDFLKSKSIPMPREIEFTRENYVRLFAGSVYTPIENVKLGEHQFEKLREKKRGYMLAAMLETLREQNGK